MTSEYGRSIMASTPRLVDAGGLENGVQGSGWNLAGTVVIDPDEPRPVGLTIVADRALLPYQSEPIGLKQTDQLTERHAFCSSKFIIVESRPPR